MRRIILLLSVISLFLFTGWTFSDAAPYIKINCSLGNDIVIYLNASSADNKIYYDDTNMLLINMSGSTQYGYFERGGEQFQITFPVYDTPYYRTSNNYTTVYITGVTRIVEKHNVEFYSQYDKTFMLMSAMIVIMFLGFLRRN